MDKRQQIITDIFHNMSAMRRLVHGKMPEKKTGKNGPTHAQMGVMFALSHHKLNVKDLAKCFGMTSSAATQLITGLVKRGWVMRQVVAGDRRKISLSLSASGQKILEKIIAERSAMFAKHLEVLTDKELGQLKSIQNKIIAHKA